MVAVQSEMWASFVLLWLLFLCAFPGHATGECTKNTCLNGGICDKNFTGKGFKCNCPWKIKADYGPRCELLIRGYSMDMPVPGVDTSYGITRHDLSGHPFEPNKLSITFEFAAHCWDDPCYIVAVKGDNIVRGVHSIPLVTVELRHPDASISFHGNRREFYVWSPAANDHTDRSLGLNLAQDKLSTDEWIESWQSMSILLWKNDLNSVTTQVELCSLRLKLCFEAVSTQLYTGDLQSAFRSSDIWIGRVSGCVRFPRVNGILVDLGQGSAYPGVKPRQKQKTFPYCPFLSTSCLELQIAFRDSGLQVVKATNRCGQDSQCDGEVVRRYYVVDPVPCKCHCINAKRRQLETISDNDKCTAFALRTNECTVDTPILKTESSNYEVTWTDQNDLPVSFSSNFFSLEASVRTLQFSVKQMLGFTGTFGNMTLFIQIANGLLHACIGTTCYPFANVTVADNEWHAVSVTVQNQHLTAMVDMITKSYTLDTAVKFSGETLRMSIPNSCVRAIRLSNIYMPTGDKDVTADSSTVFIKVHKGSGVSVKSTCSACKCAAFEYCDTSSGQPKCECKTDFIRDSQDICTPGISKTQSLIINTESADYDVKWMTKSDGPISVGSNFFSVGLSLRTHEINVPNMLSLINGKDSLPLIRISRGLLDVCIGAVCYPFPNASVSDNKWHEIYVSIGSQELTAKLDRLKIVHMLKNAHTFAGAVILVSIPNSCFRANFISNVYMPTNDSDVSDDKKTVSIKVHKGNGTSTKSHCYTELQTPPRECNCDKFEDCDTSSGQPVCNCKTGFVRDGQSNCVLDAEFFSSLSFNKKRGVRLTTGATSVLASFLLPILVQIGL